MYIIRRWPPQRRLSYLPNDRTSRTKSPVLSPLRLFASTMYALVCELHPTHAWRCLLLLPRRVFCLVASTQEDFMKAVRKIAENKKLEGKVDYAKV